MNTSRRLVASALTFGLGLTFWGCSTDTIQDQPVPNGALIPNPAVTGGAGITFPLFDTTTFQIPLPNDVIRNTGAVDPTKKGLIDFPNVAPFLSEPFVSAETIRGFSTTGNIIIPFSGRIDAASVNAQSLLLVEGASSLASPETDGANATIPYTLTVVNADPSTAGNSTIIMVPLRPLKPATNYYVTMTTSIQGQGRGIGTAPFMQASKSRTPLIDAAGNNFIFPVPNDSALTLEGLRVAYQPFWERAERILGTDRANIPIVFRFGTEPELTALAGLRAKAASVAPADATVSVLQNAALTFTGQVDSAPDLAAVNTFYTTNTPAALNPTNLNLTGVPHGNIKTIASGAIRILNYQQLHADGLYWDGEGFSASLPPIVPSTVPGNILPIPYRVCLPNGFAPPYKVVIYQHGVGRSKEDLYLIADGLCAQGFAVIGIDLPFHGQYPIQPPPATPVPQAELAFFNLTNLRAARDNFRQSTVNLNYLAQEIGAGKGNVTGDPNPDLNFGGPGTATIHFLGHSLGAIVGGVFTATEPYNQRAVISSGGGRLIQLLLNSSTRGPFFRNLLAANGVVEGTQAFTLFMFCAQTVVDDGDPINYAAPALEGILKGNPALRSRVLVQEIENDGTIPNSGTRDLSTAYFYDSNAIGFNAALPSQFRHVATVLNAVATLLPVPAPYTGADASGLSQFQPGGHEALLGIEPTTQTPTSVVNSLRAQISTFFASPAPTIIQQ